MHLNLIVSAIVLGTSISIPFILKYIKKRKKEKLDSNCISEKSNFEVIFTTGPQDCRDHIYKTQYCGKNCSRHTLDEYLRVLEMAQYSVDICNNHVTLAEVFTCLAKHKRDGLSIRIITDSAMGDVSGSQKNKFTRGGNIISWIHHY